MCETCYQKALSKPHERCEELRQRTEFTSFNEDMMKGESEHWSQKPCKDIPAGNVFSPFNKGARRIDVDWAMVEAKCAEGEYAFDYKAFHYQNDKEKEEAWRDLCSQKRGKNWPPTQLEKESMYDWPENRYYDTSHSERQHRPFRPWDYSETNRWSGTGGRRSNWSSSSGAW